MAAKRQAATSAKVAIKEMGGFCPFSKGLMSFDETVSIELAAPASSLALMYWGLWTVINGQAPTARQLEALQDLGLALEEIRIKLAHTYGRDFFQREDAGNGSKNTEGAADEKPDEDA
ncbi:MAG: hypothetical protein ACYC3G_00765 [Minisyncoccota bacterium]